MLKRVYQNSFKSSIKLDSKRGRNLDLLDNVIEKLERRIPLEPKHRDHALVGKYRGYRECHIQPDWLLIYYIEGETIVFVRTGSHTDLFDR